MAKKNKQDSLDSIMQKYLYKSGDLSILDGKTYKDVLCLDYNSTSETLRGMPPRTIVVIDKNVKVLCIRASDISRFDVIDKKREPRNWVPNYE